MKDGKKGLGVLIGTDGEKEIKLEISPEAEKELEELKNKLGLEELEELDKKCRHEPRELYCLNCGILINEEFTGGVWDYTHPCEHTTKKYKEINKKLNKALGKKDNSWLKYDDQQHKLRNHGRAFVTKNKKGEYNLLIGCSFQRDLSHAKCEECKTEKEHIRRTTQQYLGERYKEYKINNKEISEEKDNFIKLVEARIKNDSKCPKGTFIDYDELTKETVKRWTKKDGK